MATVYVNIGSNLGNRKENIDNAVKAIETCFGKCVKSSLVESEPWGFDSTNSFFNIGIRFESNLSAKDILDRLQEIEKNISPSSHRNLDGSYADRLVDIDIMAIDDLVIDEELLTVPHRWLPYRKFFLLPMKELNPRWIHPLLGKTAEELERLNLID